MKDKKQKKGSKSLGRPTKYKPEYCELVIEKSKAGETLTMIASEIGVHIDTFYEWAKVHPDFSEAKKLARQNSESFMQKMGIRGMLGHIKGFSAAAWIFWMKAQHNWDEGGRLEDQEDLELEFI